MVAQPEGHSPSHRLWRRQPPQRGGQGKGVPQMLIKADNHNERLAERQKTARPSTGHHVIATSLLAMTVVVGSWVR